MLQSIRIRRFKSIEDATIPLGRVTLLVGPNNAGKSSALQAIQFGVSVAQSLRLDNVAVWVDGRLPGTLSAQQLVYSPLRDVHALAAGGVLRQDENHAIQLTFVSDDLGTATVTVRRGKNKNISVVIEGLQLGQRMESIDEPFSVFAPGLAGIPAFEEFRSPGIVRRAAARGDANSVFRNILWALRQDGAAWQSFQNNIKQIFEKLEIEVEFAAAIHEHISASQIKEETRLPIDSSGTGVLQAIQTLAYIDVYRPRLLILDEPDSHLHPDNQRRLARLLASLAKERDFQVLISTHSRHLLDEFSHLDAKVHWFCGGEVQVDNLDRVQVLLGLGALDAGDRLRNGATPFIVLTEDSDTGYLRKILAASNLSEDECEIWSYAGCTNEPAARVLAQFIREHAPNTTIIIHRDRDYLDDAEVEAFKVRMTQAGLRPFVTEGTDIESMFLNPNHLVSVAVPLTLEKVEQLLEQATAQCEDASIQRMTNSRVKAAQVKRNKEGGDEPNYGQIAANSSALYAANPLRYRLGKSVLGRVTALIQQELEHNVECAQQSEFVRVQMLVGLKEPVGPPAAVL
jgi:ABC-type branched-subunit amino acid transport system ATPase component